MNGINNRGDIVGNVVFSDGKEHGFLLRQGIFTMLDEPDADAFTAAIGISHSGQIVGSYGADQKDHGYLRRTDGTFITVDPPGFGEVAAFAINGRGQTVGQAVTTAGGNDSHCFIATVRRGR